MIRRLHIQGFQSLADVELPLGRFTVIQGRSNSGKSAVIRALRAVATNAANLRGTEGSYIHLGSTSCSVTIERESGVLTWTKSKSKTTYDLDGRVFTTGTEVPAEVVDFLKLGDIVIDEPNSLKLNVNFQGGGRNQGQFEPPFLVVDRTGSYLAKVFALLTSANILYAAQAVAKKDSRSYGGKLKTMREVHESERARLTDLQAEYLPLHTASERAQALQTAYQSAVNERQRLVTAQEHIASLDQQLAETDQELARLSAVDVTALAESLEGLVAAQASYVAWKDALAAIDQELLNIDTQLAHTLPDGVDERLTEVEQSLEQLRSLQTWQTALAEATTGLAQIDSQIEVETTNLADAHTAFHALVEEISLCPTCNQQLEAEVMLA